MKLTPLLFLLFIFLPLQSCRKEQPLGSQNNPIKLYFTPSIDADEITSNSKELVKFLEKETNLFFEVGVPTSYVAVVEAMGSNRADIAVMNPFSYLIANKKYGVTAKLTVLRHGKRYYRGQIVAHANIKAKSMKDLNNKRFAFVDPASTSGYIFPMKVLLKHKITPSRTTFAGKHDNVIIMVYQGQVDAGATYYATPDSKGNIRDARQRVQTQFPDVAEKVKIIETTEKIPNSPVVFRKDFPANFSRKFIAALKKFLKTPEGRAIFLEIYNMEGVTDAKDSDYNGLREIVQAMNLDPSQLFKKGG